jgi:hypothetical protein
MRQSWASDGSANRRAERRTADRNIFFHLDWIFAAVVIKRQSYNGAVRTSRLTIKRAADNILNINNIGALRILRRVSFSRNGLGIILSKRAEQTVAELGESEAKKSEGGEKKKQELPVTPNGDIAKMLLRAAVVAAVKAVEALVVNAMLRVAGRNENIAPVIDALHVLGAETEPAPHEIVGLVDAMLERLPNVAYVLRYQNQVVTVMAGHGNILGEGAQHLPVLRRQILVALVQYDYRLAPFNTATHDIGKQKKQALSIGVTNRAVPQNAAEHSGARSLLVVERHGKAAKVAVDIRSSDRIIAGAQSSRDHERGEARYVAEHMAAAPKLRQNIVSDCAEALAPARQTGVSDYHRRPPLMRAPEEARTDAEAACSKTLRESLTISILDIMNTSLWRRRAEQAQTTPGGSPDKSSPNEGTSTPAMSIAVWNALKAADAATPKPQDIKPWPRPRKRGTSSAKKPKMPMRSQEPRKRASQPANGRKAMPIAIAKGPAAN